MDLQIFSGAPSKVIFTDRAISLTNHSALTYFIHIIIN